MSEAAVPGEQLALLKREVRTKRPRPVVGPAAEAPVARVAVDLPLAHLDRPFDYVVPAPLAETAVAGARVKVRFAGRDVDGFVIERADETEHVGALAPIRRVVSAEPVLRPEVLAVARLVADRYAGTLADALRLAVPPRHGRVEAEEPARLAPPTLTPPTELEALWRAEAGGTAFLERLAAGQSPRAVWTVTPGADWASQLGAAAAATLTAGRGSLICVPDVRDVARVSSAISALVGPDAYVALTADLGPAARYRAFLRVARGQIQIVVGTRAAAFAPVRALGLVAIWDDGDDLHAEPRAPYPHVREVLLLRAHHESTAALIGSFARSVEAQALVESRWAASLVATRDTVRASAPQVHVTGEDERESDRDAAARTARVPRRVFEVVREALKSGPVLVSSPRAGYQPALACDSCRQPARCQRCAGPLARSNRQALPRCRWCATEADAWTCPHCHGHTLRAPVVGSLRTTEEWGRSFPQTPVVRSGGDHIIETVPATPAIVIATTGAEPTAEGGYTGAVLLDTWLALNRADLRAGEEALRRWMNVAALVKPGEAGGRVIAVGDPGGLALQALVRWDPAGFAARELVSRRSAHLTPAARMATVQATPDAITEVLAALELPRYAEVLGPVEVDDDLARIVLRAPRERGAALAQALQHVQAGRSARKLPPVRVQVDPSELI
jgi:primosomal protein N' (replication factor Y)